jgi:4-amino-4-deoxy-L-arabinose transferase-like glycosyltransferase
MTQEKDRIKRAELIFLALLAVLIVYFRSMSNTMPLDMNEGSYAYTASRMMAGDAPYKDVFEHRPPFAIYVYKAAFSLFGASVLSIRYFATLYVLITCLLIYMLARTLWHSAFTAMTAALFYAIYQHSLVLSGFSADAQLWAQLPVVLSIFFALDRDRKYEKVNFTVSGFFAAVTFFTSPLSVLFVFMPAVYIFIYLKENRIKNILWYFTGFFALVILVLGWAAINHMLKEFLTATWAYNIYFFTSKLASKPGINSADVFNGFIWINILPFMAFVYCLIKVFLRKKEGVNFLLTFSTVSIAAALIIAGNSPANYYILLIPTAALLCAQAVFDLNASFVTESEGKKYLWAADLSLLLIACAVYAASNNLGIFLAKGKFAPDIYYEISGLSSVIDSQSQGLDRKKDFLLAWPNLPAAYFLTHSKADSIYPSAYPLDYFVRNKHLVTDAFYNELPVWLLLEKGTYANLQSNIDNHYGKTAETKNLVLYREVAK